MRNVVSYGPDTKLEVVECSVLVPGPDQILINVEAIGVGRVDYLMRQALPAQFVPGIEVAGVVSVAGDGVEPGLVGRRVFARLSSGGYADQVLTSPDQIVSLPDNLQPRMAVASGINALVARFALARASVGKGERVLIRGARGGIGHLVVQMAKSLGAEVVEDVAHGNTVSADVVIDLVAGPETGKHLKQLNANGRYVMAGIAAGMPPDDFASVLMTEFRRSLSFATFSLDTIADSESNLAAAQIFAEVEAGLLKPVIAQEFELAHAQQAHDLLAQAAPTGKFILRP